MQLVHSFYTKYMNNANLFLQSACFAVSCLYAKKSGFKINLHTDSRGFKILEKLPYDNIIIDLDDVILDAPGVYAAVKFKVMEKYPLGTIHIDGDVFLKRNSIKEILEFNDYDIIVQSLETPPLYGKHWKESAQLFANCDYPKWANRECAAMFNCGVIGINNEKLRKKYYKTYWNMYKQLKEKCNFSNGVPDIIIEQQFLLDLCKKYKYKIKYIIDGNNPSKSANKIGYQHLIGETKAIEYKNILKCMYDLDKNQYINFKNIFYDSFKNIWPNFE